MKDKTKYVTFSALHAGEKINELVITRKFKMLFDNPKIIYIFAAELNKLEKHG